MIVRALLLSLLLAATIVSAIGVVYARQQSRLAFVELSRLGGERDNLNFEYGRLQLEQATWADNNRVDQIARGRLGMLSPAAADVQVIRR